MTPSTLPARRLATLGLLLLALAAPATRAQIANTPEDLDIFGSALAAGDFDGDLYVDLAVGVPYEGLGSASRAGAVNVIYGNVGGLTDDGNQFWSQDSPGIADVAENDDLFGFALATGDFDGDGYDDLVIGAPTESRDGFTSVGQVHVIYGGPSGLTSAGSFYFPQLTAVHTGKLFGASLTAGDFNGDGFDDLAASARGQNLGSATGAGAVAVFFGSNTGIRLSGYQTWHQNIAGIADQAETSDSFGYALTAGDFNGNGVDDLAIGVVSEDLTSVSDAGAVHVLYGTAAGLSATGSQFWNQASPGVEGDLGNDLFGYILAATDFNADGSDDLAIGVVSDDAGSVADAGTVNVLYGSAAGLTATGDQLWHQDVAGVLDVAAGLDQFGYALAGGDFDLDGAGDLAIGVPQDDFGATEVGAVNVLYGTAGTGLTTTDNQLWYQGTTGIPDDPEASDRFGVALAAGDFGSSFADALAIGVTGEDVGGAIGAGAVNVIYGVDGTGLNTTSQTPQFLYQGLNLPLPASRAGEKGGAVAAVVTETPGTLALLPATPSPFTDQTTLRFTLPAPVAVRLAVYDVLGREVAVLVDGQREAGLHEATFDGRGLSSGTYVYRLVAGSEVQTGRMSLAR